MIAVDFETYYARTHTVSDYGPWAYAHHPDTDIYMVSVRGEGMDYVGDAAAFNWASLAGKDLVSHNAAFDATVYQAGVTRKMFPAFTPRSWSCSADLAAYCGLPRALADATEAAFGEKVSKLMRNWMSGKRWADAVAKGKDKELLAYARRDSELCLKLWTEHAPLWPAHERRLSAHTRALIWRGVNIDTDGLKAGMDTLRAAKDAAAQGIPWAAGGEAVLSLAVLRNYCRTVGVPAPASMAKDSEECVQWEDQYSEQFPFIRAIRDYRRVNMLLRKFEGIERRVREDGTMPVNLKYWGAHTGRWSGDAGVNLQNLPRGEMYGANLRPLLRPTPGKVFVIVDLSQIEPRVLSWLADDMGMLAALRAGMPLYEAHARATMGWTGGKLKDQNPDLYRLAKARVLGLGYGCGAGKFKSVAHAMAGLELGEDECDKVVRDWRRTNPDITAYWRALDHQLAGASTRRGDFLYALPSGREMRWTRPGPDPEDPHRMIAGTVKNGPRSGTWGGKLTENVVQAVARDVFADALLRLEAAGLPVIWHVHDEVIIEVDTASGAEALAETIRILSTPPEWATHLPLAAEGSVENAYTK